MTATKLACVLLAAAGWTGRPKLVPPAGMEATLEAEGAKQKLRFRKAGTERRLLAVELDALPRTPQAKALCLTYSLRLTGGEARAALVAFEKDAATWFRLGARPLETGEKIEARLPLKALHKAAFSRDGGNAMDWDGVQKLWVGVVLDGKASGELVLHSAEITDRPYRPTRAMAIPCTDPKQWGLAHDPAAKAAVTAGNDAPGEAASVKIDFAFPGGSHMYVVPSVRLADVDLTGYRALRLTYKATVPEGIGGLLVMLIERGGAQYPAEPAPATTGEWRTLTIPLKSFHRGGWSKDDNGRLDLDDVASVAVGVHGTARPARARGAIHVAKIELVP